MACIKKLLLLLNGAFSIFKVKKIDLTPCNSSSAASKTQEVGKIRPGHKRTVSSYKLPSWLFWGRNQVYCACYSVQLECGPGLFWELCKYGFDSQAKKKTGASPGTHSYPWNKQTVQFARKPGSSKFSYCACWTTGRVYLSQCKINFNIAPVILSSCCQQCILYLTDSIAWSFSSRIFYIFPFKTERLGLGIELLRKEIC